MKRESLLTLIAETGYNVGYGAKKHFATYDIIEKIPGWIALFSIAAGVFALFVPALEAKWVAASFLVISVASGSILLYESCIDRTHGGQVYGDMVDGLN